MIKAPSLINDYSLVWSGDPSLQLPSDPKERDRALSQARETGNWNQWIGPDGEGPTVFHLRNLDYGDIEWWNGESKRKNLGDMEQNSLLLRMALKGVENLGNAYVEQTKIKTGGGERLLVSQQSWESVSRALDVFALPVIAELTDLIVRRSLARPASPKS